mmetsp:Transcript_93726/g.201161  ORF Transcript_93726/g.201161 Transcript_93726/m.201161 type:complete len:269 (-) Transcript_93726:80-886(-)
MAFVKVDGKWVPRSSMASASIAPDREQPALPTAPREVVMQTPGKSYDAMKGSHWIIDDFLCVGNFKSAGVTGTTKSVEQKRIELREHGVTHIVNCTKEFGCPLQNDFEYLQLHATDDTHQLMIQFWPAVCDFIEEAKAAGGRVLVHCAGGHSRSGSTALAYLMKSRNLTLSEALALAQERRTSISPNPGFLEQLQVWHRLRFVAPSKGEFRTPVTFPAGVMQRFRCARIPPNAIESGTKSANSLAVPCRPGVATTIGESPSTHIALDE